MNKQKQIVHYPTRQTNQIVIRRKRHMKRFRFNFMNYTFQLIAFYSLITASFMGVGALGSWGLEIIDANSRPTVLRSHDWKAQKNICLGGMALSFSIFLGSALLGACFGNDSNN